MSTEIKVGVLVLIAIVVMAYFVVRIEDPGFLGGDTDYRVRVLFENVAGLTADAPVLLAGVRVGRVESVGVTDDGRAEVVARMRRDVVLYDDAVASVASLGVMGDKYLEVQPGTPGAGRVPDGGTIRGGRPTSMDQMVAVVSEIADDLKTTTESISNVLGTEEGESSMREILTNIEGFTGELQEFLDANRGSLDTGVRDFESTVGSFNRLATELETSLPEVVSELRSLSGEIRGLVADNEDKLGTAADNIVVTTERLDRSATDLEEILSKINRGEGSLSRLINEPETIEKMETALESVDDALSAADTFFSRVGGAQFSFSLRTEGYADSEATKNYFGFRLEIGEVTGERALILHLVDDNIGGFDETNIITETFDAGGTLIDTTFERQLVREEGFTVSAELAQRLGDNWQLRGGLLESEAGVGVDWLPNDPRWRLSLEIWDFGRDPDPHVKLRGQYRFAGRFFFTAGWDDLLNEDLRQIFFGGGYAFR